MFDTKYPSRGRARIGIVVPVSNSNLEPDMTMLAPPGVSLHFTRAGGYDVDKIPDEKQMQHYSDTPADELFTGLKQCGAEIILYGCTSATLAQGPDYDSRFRHHIEALTGLPALTAADCLVRTLKALGIARFAFASPYVASLNDLAIGFLGSFALTCVSRYDAPLALGNPEVAAVTPDEIVKIAASVDHTDAEAIVLSCTDYRATEAIDEIERITNKPVITSSQATLMLALNRLGISTEESPLANHLATRRLDGNFD